MRSKLYIDGQAGTTALRIRDWLAERDDIEVVVLPEALRKEPSARRQALQSADIALLCLPDDAAKEAASWVADSTVRILDASTAHRVTDGWVYGLPELMVGQRERIARAKRVANPGCYASAVILLVRPLIDAGLIAPDTFFSIHALSGYSGGGRSMIERWEDPRRRLLELPARGALQHRQAAQAYSGDYALRRIEYRTPVSACGRTLSMRHAGTSHSTVQSLIQVRHGKSDVGNPGVAIRE